MRTQLKAAQERLDTATAQALRSFAKLRKSQTDVCNSLKSHSSAKMAAVKDYDAPMARAPRPPETPAEAASENGVDHEAGHEEDQPLYFDEDTQLTLIPEESELSPEELTESKLLERKRKNPKISGSSQLGLASP